MNIYNKEKILISSVLELDNREINLAYEDRSNICKFYNKNELLNLSEQCMYEKLDESEYDYIHPCFDLDDKESSLSYEIKKTIAYSLFNELIPNFFIYVKENDKTIIINKELCLDIIKKNIAITISTDENKLSIHSNYPNIILKRELMANIINKYFSIWIDSITSDNKFYQYKQFLNYIDKCIYKKNMSLRAINSFKPDGSGRLEILQNNNRLDHYFSYLPNVKDYIMFTINNSSSGTYDNNMEKVISEINNVNIKVEKENEIINFVKDIIKNSCSIDKSLEYNKHIAIKINYNENCALCNKISHKNNHVMILNDTGRLTIYKSGNKDSCKTYSTLLDISSQNSNEKENLISYIISLEILYKTNNNIFIGWTGQRWLQLDIKNITGTEYTIDAFLYSIAKKFPVEYFKLLSNIFWQSSGINTFINNLKYHIPIIIVNRFLHTTLIAFNNGIYNVSTGNFIVGAAAKKYILYETIDREYTESVNFEIKEELENIINKIQPNTEDNIENRIRFEKCLASSIVFKTKRINYIFMGMTKSGKTVIKDLLLNTLGNKLSDKCEAQSFSNENNSGPNHELANTDNKTLVCISELKQGFKLSAQIFKKITERTISARRNYSTATTNSIINVATHIFDCNNTIDFTEHTPSVYQRICTIMFKTKFLTGDEDNEMIGDTRVAFKADLDLTDKISSGRYDDEMFRYLSYLYRKHFSEGFGLESYCHPSLPISKTIKLCNTEIFDSNKICEELTLAIKQISTNNNYKIVYYNSRYKIFSSKDYIANELANKYDDLEYNSNEKYKQLKIYNIKSFFNENTIYDTFAMILHDDYKKFIQDERISDEIKQKQINYLNNIQIKIIK
jgi:hypothetical protein